MTRAILDKLCFTSSQQPASVGNEDAESLLAEVGLKIDALVPMLYLTHIYFKSVVKRMQFFCKPPWSGVFSI